MPSVQSPETIQANADLLRRLAAAIGLTGQTLVEVCERVVVDARAETASRMVDRPAAIDGAARLDAASEIAGEG